MKKLFFFPLFFFLFLRLTAQTVQSPAEIYGELFTDVQMRHVFPDSKTFADCTPKRDPKQIVKDYLAMKNDSNIRFKLDEFVTGNFDLPKAPQLNYITQEKDVVMHIKNLWNVLRRDADSSINGSSLLALPNPYIVPGGRFGEIYYWDSYFTMLGLKESGRVDMIENMVKNFAHLITTYGHIPNGNRTYYISRSQPPFFGLMLELLNEQGKNLTTYYQALEKEYLYWMEDAFLLKPGEASKRVVRMDDGTLLNRYWDTGTTPRQESFREDVMTADAIVENFLTTHTFSSTTEQEHATNQRRQKAYADLRAAAASGWDFSSRWFNDGCNLTSIETTDIIPIDLNCLLLYYENSIGKHTSDVTLRQAVTANASKRLAALTKYFWHPELQFFTDYHFIDKQPTTRLSLAGLFPLFFSYATQEQAQSVAQKIETSF